VSLHYLIIEKDTEYAERFPNFDEERRYRLECPEGNGCSGFSGCNEPHIIDGKNANGGPWDCDEGEPWDGMDAFTFHGEEHTWRSGFGWVVPYKGKCVIAECDWEPPEGADSKPYGRYPVEDDWFDETSVDILWIEADQ
jgi:hypothetical protein